MDINKIYQHMYMRCKRPLQRQHRQHIIMCWYRPYQCSCGVLATHICIAIGVFLCSASAIRSSLFKFHQFLKALIKFHWISNPSHAHPITQVTRGLPFSLPVPPHRAPRRPSSPPAPHHQNHLKSERASTPVLPVPFIPSKTH
jgi:hypothetical protein